MSNIQTNSSLYEFSIPSMYGTFGEEDEIISCLEDIARIAMYCAGNDEMDLVDFVESILGISFDDYNPYEEYYKSVNALYDRVGEYNSVMSNNGLINKILKVDIDNEYAEMLKNTYPSMHIYRVSQ